MFVVFRKSDCDTKYIIFKVKNPTSSTLSPPGSLLPPVPQFGRSGELLAGGFLGERQGPTPREGVVGEEPAASRAGRPVGGLRGAASLVFQARPQAPAGFGRSLPLAGGGARGVPFPGEGLGPRSLRSLLKAKCRAGLWSLTGLGAPMGAAASARPAQDSGPGLLPGKPGARSPGAASAGPWERSGLLALLCAKQLRSRLDHEDWLLDPPCPQARTHGARGGGGGEGGHHVQNRPGPAPPRPPAAPRGPREATLPAPSGGDRRGRRASRGPRGDGGFVALAGLARSTVTSD